jgi:protein TonB
MMTRACWALLFVVGLGVATVRAGEADVPPDVARVFDRNKGQLFAVYTRALRDEPTLQGKVTFQVTLDPSGTASECLVLSSDLRAPDVEKKMCERIKLMKFDPQMESRTVTKSVRFYNRVDLPAN